MRDLYSIKMFQIFININPERNPKPIIITEYIKNGSLEGLLEKERSNVTIPFLNDTMRLIIIYGIASAMSYLHSEDIIYRDLKPSNILLDENYFPKLSDFSKSSHTYDDFKDINNVINNSVFSAPEIIYNNIKSKASEVYSFGMIVYEIMAKKYPFEKVDHFKMMHDVVFLKKRPEIPPFVPKAYKNLIEACWNDDPGDRLSFRRILYELENNKEFININVDAKKYFMYIKYVKGQLPQINEFKMENIIKSTNQNHSDFHQKETTLYLPSELANIKVQANKFGKFAAHLEIQMTLSIESPSYDDNSITNQQQLDGSIISPYFYPAFWQPMTGQPFSGDTDFSPVIPYYNYSYPNIAVMPYYGYYYPTDVGIPFSNVLGQSQEPGNDGKPDLRGYPGEKK